MAINADGMYIDLEDGRRVIDAVGGAAVACIGNGHPKVVQAIKDQVDKISCAPIVKSIFHLCVLTVPQMFTTCNSLIDQQKT